jgi:hypothetical protein
MKFQQQVVLHLSCGSQHIYIVINSSIELWCHTPLTFGLLGNSFNMCHTVHSLKKSKRWWHHQNRFSTSYYIDNYKTVNCLIYYVSFVIIVIWLYHPLWVIHINHIYIQHFSSTLHLMTSRICLNYYNHLYYCCMEVSWILSQWSVMNFQWMDLITQWTN